MRALLKSVLLNNVQLKLFSLILGYVCWSIIAPTHNDDIWLDVPVCFYQTETNIQIAAPETVKVNFSGKRGDLRDLDMKSMAIHIDTRKLAQGKQTIALSERQLTLPEKVCVTGWAPTHMEIEVREKT